MPIFKFCEEKVFILALFETSKPNSQETAQKSLKKVLYKSVLELLFTPTYKPMNPPSLKKTKHHNRCTLS
jgi:hypothetical protein